MPNNAFQAAYAAAKEIMADVATAASATISQAPSNHGTDFRITPGTARYQVQISPQPDYRNSNVNYPRCIVYVLIHHYATSLANEEAFLHSTMFQVSERFCDPAYWRAEAGIYDVQPGIEIELSEGTRQGNVLTFEVSVALLCDAT